MMNLSNKIRMMIIKVVNRLDNHPNLLNEMNKIRMMMIITLMMLSYFGDVQEGTQLVRKFLVVVSEYSESFEFTTEEDIYSDNFLGDKSDDYGKSDDYDNYDDYDEISEIFEDYSAPDYEPFQPFQPPSNSNQFLWILLWIM